MTPRHLENYMELIILRLRDEINNTPELPSIYREALASAFNNVAKEIQKDRKI